MADDNPVVGVVMGSKSDMPVMEECLKKLEDFDLTCEVRIISAHRTPKVAHDYATAARGRGLKVIIAAAGMSAALGGTLAANTTIPIIGVPVASGSLNGIDALLSTTQMPPGVPVGCMAIGKPGAVNAAVYAAEIIAVTDPKTAEMLSKYKNEMAEKVQAADKNARGD